MKRQRFGLDTRFQEVPSAEMPRVPETLLQRDIKGVIDAIEELREAKKWTIVDLARHANGNYRSYNNWKQGHHVPTLEKLKPWVAAVGAELRLFAQRAGASVKRMTQEGAEVAEYVNNIPERELRVEVREAVRRLIPTLRDARWVKKPK